MFWTKCELEKLHLHFEHLSSGKLYNVQRRLKPRHKPSEVINNIKQIAEARSTCTRTARTPFRFRVSIMKDGLRFNTFVEMDLVWIDRRAILHVIDTYTIYQNSAFVKDQSVEGLLQLFFRIWGMDFSGCHDFLRLDRNPSFMGRSFRLHLMDVVWC